MLCNDYVSLFLFWSRDVPQWPTESFTVRCWHGQNQGWIFFKRCIYNSILNFVVISIKELHELKRIRQPTFVLQVLWDRRSIEPHVREMFYMQNLGFAHSTIGMSTIFLLYIQVAISYINNTIFHTARTWNCSYGRTKNWKINPRTSTRVDPLVGPMFYIRCDTSHIYTFLCRTLHRRCTRTSQNYKELYTFSWR